MFTTNRLRRAGSFLLGGGALVALLLTTLVPGLAPWSPEPPIANASDICKVSFYALDPSDATKPNPNKEVTGAFGPAVTPREEAGIKAELNERRECGSDGTFDPSLTAAHYSEWSFHGLTSMSVTPEEIDAFAARLATDPTLHGQVLSELKRLESESAFSTEAVPAGTWSLYMMPDGSGGVTVKVGTTSIDGVNAVFTHPNGVVIRYRLDCGFQPNRSGGFPGIPTCTPGECTPPPPPAECPPGTTGTPPDCYNLKWQQETVVNEGWTVRGTDNQLTDGRESERQHETGQVRGNAGSDQVGAGTQSGDVTSDTAPSDKGGPVVGGGTSGGDNRKDDVTNKELVADDPGGTEGATCTPTPLVTC